MSTINYIYPGSGTVPATGPQASECSRQVVQVLLDTPDTIFVVTHNYNFNTLALARLCPHVIITPEGAASGVLGIQARVANEIDVACAITTGGTFELMLDRPHSILMPSSV
jgi:hypothetical protein